MAQLYVVAFGVGLLTTFFDVAAPSYLPSLVGRDRLLAANGALQSGAAAVNVIGPNLGGMLVQALGAPLAIAADVATYLVSALTLGTIRTREPPPTAESARPRMPSAAAEGIRHLTRHAVLRPLALTSAGYSFFQGMRAAMIVLFLTGTLGFEPLTLGVLWGGRRHWRAGRSARRSAPGGDDRHGACAPVGVPDRPFQRPCPAGRLHSRAGAADRPDRPVRNGFLGADLRCQCGGPESITYRGPATWSRPCRQSLRIPQPGTARRSGRGLLGGAIGLQAGLLVAAAAITMGALWVYRSPVPAVR